MSAPVLVALAFGSHCCSALLSAFIIRLRRELIILPVHNRLLLRVYYVVTTDICIGRVKRDRQKCMQRKHINTTSESCSAARTVPCLAAPVIVQTYS